MVNHGVGVPEIDERIALGYLKVNTGNLEEGIRMFSGLIADRPDLVAAYLGRGTALAIQRHFVEAVSDFSAALRVDSKCGEGWKRRGQTRAAFGALKDALFDLNQVCVRVCLRLRRATSSLRCAPPFAVVCVGDCCVLLFLG
jgi:tetratricopeptide (TPR) repeat protein